LAITVGLIAMYWLAVGQGNGERTTAAMVFVTLITANMVLTLVNRSFYYSIFTTFGYRNKLLPLMLLATFIMVAAIFLFPPLTHFFGFEALSPSNFACCITTGVLSVIWLEGYKFMRRMRSKVK
jgi:Ca2+-transporting ATPase